jgi:hypothetical protein
MAKGEKTGGRTAGTPNKVTKEAREKFQWLLDNYTEEDMKKDLKALSPRDRLFFVSDIAEFIVPKLSRQELTGKGGKDLQQTPLLFVPAKSLTDEQLEKYLNNDARTDDESI